MPKKKISGAMPPISGIAAEIGPQFVQQVLDNIFDAVVACDPSGSVTLFNRTAGALYGFERGSDPDSLLSIPHPPLHPCTDRLLSATELPLVRAIRAPNDMHEVPFDIVRGNGVRVSMVAHATAIRDVRKRVIGAVSVARDVTSARAAAALAQVNEERYRASRNAVLDAFMLLDPVRDAEGRVVDLTFRDVNDQAERMLGRPHDELIDHSFTELFPDADISGVYEPYRRVLNSGVSEEEEVRAPHLGEEVWMQRRIIRLGEGVVVSARDVTDRRLREEVMRQEALELSAARDAAERARVSAESANRAKSEFLSRMSHELRTPLNAIIGFTGVLLRNRRGQLDDTDVSYLARIGANGRHLLGLINNVLDLAKIEAGHMHVSWERVDVELLVEDVCGTLAERALESGITLEILRNAAAGLGGPLVRADETKLKQVLLNLVSNAIKFTPRGGNVTVAIDVDPGSGYPLRLVVRDTGIGIAPEAHARIFRAFEQAESGTTARFGGTGLGLPISRALCEAMGFRLMLESEPGTGSTSS